MATLYYRPYTSELETESNGEDNTLPPENAITALLPEYIMPAQEQPRRRPPPQQPVREQKTRPVLQPRADPVVEEEPKPIPEVREDAPYVFEEPTSTWMPELERYRVAVRRMAADILSLRDRVRDLEAENSNLRREQARNADMSLYLAEATDLDGMPKADIIAKYVTLRQKMTGCTAELVTYRDRVQRLQNDLIKKNEKEEQLLKIKQAHTAQNAVIHKLQDRAEKAKKLEETVRQQEKIIAKMEEQLEKRNKQRASRAPDPRTLPPVPEAPTPREPTELAKLKVVAEENRLLRRQLDEFKQPQQLALEAPDADETDLLSTYQLLDTAQSRILALESQLQGNSRKWGKEKEGMRNRIRELEHGVPSPVDLQMNSPAGSLQMGPSDRRLDRLNSKKFY